MLGSLNGLRQDAKQSIRKRIVTRLIQIAHLKAIQLKLHPSNLTCAARLNGLRQNLATDAAEMWLSQITVEEVPAVRRGNQGVDEFVSEMSCERRRGERASGRTGEEAAAAAARPNAFASDGRASPLWPS